MGKRRVSRDQYNALMNLCIYLLLIAVVNGDHNKFQDDLTAQEADRVHNLPGQPKANFAHYAGYITVNESHGRALFYWFFEAENQPSEKPLVLWLNGGPGCSSVGYGAAQELGPFQVRTNGTGLSLNKYSWNREANLLFLESPVGVGFSYTNTSSDLLALDDQFTAEDSYEFLVRWFQRFPQYKTHDFYIGGESYAGHYVPQLAELVYDRSQNNSKYPPINFKGFIVGNPETDDFHDWEGIVDYAWTHAIISDQTYNLIKSICNFKLLNWTDQCTNAVNLVFEEYNEIDIYNIYAPRCLKNSNSGVRTRGKLTDSQNKVSRRAMGFLYGGYDPCYEVYTNEYFNRPDVQEALHANVTKIPFKWAVCNNSVLATYIDKVFSVLPIYTKLIKGGLRLWVYSGDIDGRVPVTATKYSINALHLPIKQQWHPWFHDRQVAGWFIQYQGLTHLTFRGAGHLVPLNKRRQALLMIKSYLQNKDLPIKR